MPPSVVKPDEFAPTVRKMLKGVAVPPGFNAADVVARSVPTDRYQLGASVAGAVSCTWFARWAAARRSGNRGEVRAAVAAMATAKDWPVIPPDVERRRLPPDSRQPRNRDAEGSVYKQRRLEG